jgi:hypothetical protein
MKDLNTDSSRSFLYEAGMKQIDNTDIPMPTKGKM